MSRLQEQNDNIIDLTGESYTPRRSTFLRINGLQPAQDVVDLDDVEDTDGSRDDDSPDVEHLYTRQLSPAASVHVGAPNRERPTSQPRMSEPAPAPAPAAQNTVHIGPLSRLVQHISTMQAFSGTRRMVQNTPPQPHPNLTHHVDARELHINMPDPRHLEAMGGFGPHGFRVPDMNFEATAFNIGRERPPQPVATYGPPPEPRAGFTRSPTEDSTLVCPNCGEELGVGEDDLGRQVWVVKSCGHVSTSTLQIRGNGFLNSHRSTVASARSAERRKRPRLPSLPTSGHSRSASSMDVAGQKSLGPGQWFSYTFENIGSLLFELANVEVICDRRIHD